MKWLKTTTLHINAIIITIVLALLQYYILGQLNGDEGSTLRTMFENHDVAGLGMVFSPTAGIIWALKHFARKPSDQKEE